MTGMPVSYVLLSARDRHQSRLLYDALKRAGVEAELVLVKGGGHGGPEFRKPDIRGKVEAFFDKHLKPAA
jgi:dipeptidyl aminopeptidase/acylaminoacyl peptidase